MHTCDNLAHRFTLVTPRAAAPKPHSVNGVPSCANNWLLGTLLRDSWGFDGAVVSDCDAVNDVFSSHHYTATPELAVQAVLRAGTDVDCGAFASQHAQSALNQGVITQADLDTVLVRQFKLRIRLGHFDPNGPLQTIGPDQVCNPYCELSHGVRMLESAEVMQPATPINSPRSRRTRASARAPLL